MHRITICLQRSTDGRAFAAIGEQQPLAGTGLHSYAYHDINAAALHPGRLYYRVQAINADGNTTLSPTVAAEIQNNKKPFTVMPSPAKDVLHLAFAQNVKGIIVIYYADGKPVSRQIIQNTSRAEVNVSRLTAGEYFIKVYTDENVMSSRFIKE